MPEEQMTTDDWLYKLSCIPCDKLKEEKKVEFKGIETKPLLTLTAFVLAILLLLGKNDKTSKI